MNFGDATLNPRSRAAIVLLWRSTSMRLAVALAASCLASVAAAQSKPAIHARTSTSTPPRSPPRASLPRAPPPSSVPRRPTGRTASTRSDLWLWTEQAGLQPLTHSGSEENPQWSPDGQWIAFASDRALPGDDARRRWQRLQRRRQGPPHLAHPAPPAAKLFRSITENLDVHAFAWSTDGAAIYFTATEPPHFRAEGDSQGRVARRRPLARAGSWRPRPQARRSARPRPRRRQTPLPDHAEKEKADKEKSDKTDKSKSDKKDKTTLPPGRPDPGQIHTRHRRARPIA